MGGTKNCTLLDLGLHSSRKVMIIFRAFFFSVSNLMYQKDLMWFQPFTATLNCETFYLHFVPIQWLDYLPLYCLAFPSSTVFVSFNPLHQCISKLQTLTNYSIAPQKDVIFETAIFSIWYSTANLWKHTKYDSVPSVRSIMTVHDWDV